MCERERKTNREKARERERQQDRDRYRDKKMTSANKDLVYLDIFVLFDKMISCSLHRWGAVQ